MSRLDAVVLASRTLAVLVTLWVLFEASYVPAEVFALHRYMGHEITKSSDFEYWDYYRHHYVIEFGFLMTRIVGLTLLARWLFKGGPEVADLLLPPTRDETGVHS